ncbi:tryptophan synthase subunit alpha [Sporolactobacillus shoreicorticis]|uniref:Tryptophan synthase alpha chain n=1 Tax=Sporolactobacillus shoreicorticis TaxID=1923877 RepID=A0ABW5S1I9_9BACL|nr:tryptophan synthase subunit alpha [Sporolactobacillus shoreicorticis]MCO7127027.1 tryptophan synthase subunit alpha [Sporolactobacillus shoreicorticis]
MTDRMREYITKDKGMLFIPFITAGDPDNESTIQIALMLQSVGANALELGIPYSDPLADGPVIQQASKRALSHGETLLDAMTLVKTMRRQGLKIPVIIFTYANVLLQFGVDVFFQQAKTVGVDGLLVPDLPYEESRLLADSCLKKDMSLISLVAPTTSKHRLSMICREAQGFIYCVSSLGVTGVRKKFHPDVFPFLRRVKKVCQIPIAVGFGISSFEQVEKLENNADGFIVGSAIVSLIGQCTKQLNDPATRSGAVDQIRRQICEKLMAPVN